MTEKRQRAKSVGISCWVDVDVDLGDLELDDLVEEIERRGELKKVRMQMTKTEAEEYILMQRFFEERRRAVTHGSGITVAERDFWHHVHGRDI